MLTIQKAALIHSEMDRIFKEGESSFLSETNIQKTHKICKYMDSMNSLSTLFIKDYFSTIDFIKSLKIDDIEVMGYKSKKHETCVFTAYFRTDYIDIEKICELATPAFFGKGSETIYDENIRKAFEVTADRITIEEKSEDCFKEIFYYHFEKDLVPPGKKFVCKLYKMHIYKEGGKFERHKDTIHTPNHYATFIISIPTEFKGGKLLLYENKGDENPITECDFKYYNAVIFLTDVEHEVTPVESGTRIVLQYDVYLENKDENNNEDEEEEEDSECPYQKSEKEYLATENYVNKLKTEAEINILQEVIDFKEKHSGDEISFLLTREYPLTVDLECLKAGDRKLYDILSTEYLINLGYVVNNFRSSYDCEFDYDERKRLKVMNYSDTENFLNYVINGNSEDNVKNSKNTHIFISGGSFHTLKSIDYIEHTGNESAPAEYSYVSLVLNIKNKV